MQPQHRSDRLCGFTLVELLVVIAIVAVLTALIVPTSVDKHEKSNLAVCRNNLTQIGLAIIMYANDNNDNFPSLVSTNNEGAKEYVADERIDLHCQALVPYLGSPNVLCCPTDTRKPATDFAGLQNGNMSYFASLDADTTNFTFFLTGDRNLMINGKTLSAGMIALTATDATGWSKEMHFNEGGDRRGNIGFPDGHVESVHEQSSSSLAASLGTATNRLVFP